MRKLLVYIVFLVSCANGLFAQLSNDNTLLLIKAYNKSHQFDKANELFKHHTQNLSTDLLLEKGNMFYASGNYKEAANCYYRVHQANTKKASLELARCYALMQKTDLACAMLEQHLKLKEREMQRTIKTDTAFLSIEKSVAWKNLWKNEWYTKYDLQFEDATIAFDNANYENALQIVNELIAIRKTKYEAYALKAEIYLALEEYKNGLITINQAIDKRPKEAHFYYLKSKLELKTEKYKQAGKSINKALELDNSEIEYYFVQIETMAKQNRSNEAFEAIDLLILLYPNVKVFQLAAEIYTQAKEYQMAIKAMNKCINMEKYNPDFYILRGDLYLQTKLYTFAEKDYSMGLDFYPQRGDLFFKRGLSRLNQQKNNDACTDFNKAFYFQYMPANDYISKYCRNFKN
jgi:tetratricopeptide (TPR) repeat protein